MGNPARKYYDADTLWHEYLFHRKHWRNAALIKREQIAFGRIPSYELNRKVNYHYQNLMAIYNVLADRKPGLRSADVSAMNVIEGRIKSVYYERPNVRR